MNTKVLYYAAAATTAIAGILHLIMTPNILNFSPNGAILFSVGGAAQIFWAIPMIRRWRRISRREKEKKDERRIFPLV